jgi:probable HAF family extracellular repeat protein
MQSMRRGRAWTFAALCSVFALGSVGTAQLGPRPLQLPATYDIEDLGVVNGNSFATGINDAGEVSGYAFDGCCARAFLFTPPGPAQYRPIISYGQGVSQLGLLVGDRAVAPIGGGAYQAFRLINNTEQLVPTLSGYAYSQGLAINDWNDVAGDAYNIPDTKRRAFLNTLNGTEDLGALDTSGAGGPSYARGVNDHDEVVGYSPPNGYFPRPNPYWEVGHAFYWNRAAGMVDLDLSVTGHGSKGTDYFELTKASAINLHHRIVGYAVSTDLNLISAFMLQQTIPGSGTTPPTFRFENLGTLPGGSISYALAVNRGYAAVGVAYNAGSDYRAALFSDGRVIDLNDAIVVFGVLWRLRMATGINDHGQIVGWGEYNGGIHAFKLTPRPHLSVTADPWFRPGRFLVGVDGTQFSANQTVRVEVRVGDIGGTLIRSGIMTADSAGRIAFGALAPCNTEVVVNALDVDTGAYSNAANVNFSCQ